MEGAFCQPLQTLVNIDVELGSFLTLLAGICIVIEVIVLWARYTLHSVWRVWGLEGTLLSPLLLFLFTDLIHHLVRGAIIDNPIQSHKVRVFILLRICYIFCWGCFIGFCFICFCCILLGCILFSSISFSCILCSIFSSRNIFFSGILCRCCFVFGCIFSHRGVVPFCIVFFGGVFCLVLLD